MKKFVFGCMMLVAFLATSLHADALVSVKGYYRKNGTYVAPHYRTSPDSTRTNNFSYNGYTTKGMSYGQAAALESRLNGYSYGYTPKLSKREKKVEKCKLTGKSEAQCKAIHMSKKKKK